MHQHTNIYIYTFIYIHKHTYIYIDVSVIKVNKPCAMFSIAIDQVASQVKHNKRDAPEVIGCRHRLTAVQARFLGHKEYVLISRWRRE